MNAKAVGLFASLLALSTLPAVAATPQLSGSYMVGGTRICQVVTNGVKVGPGGNVAHYVGNATFTPTATGATGKLELGVVGGRMITATPGMLTVTKSNTTKTTVTGTANPFTLSFVTSDQSGSSTQTGRVVFGSVRSGIAGRAVFLLDHATPGTDGCAMQLLLTRE